MKKKLPKSLKWIFEHVRPFAKVKKPEWEHGNLEWKNKEDIEKNIKEHGTVGIKFKWKF